MNSSEVVVLCRYIKATFPVQRVDELTPDAWAEGLADIPYEVAKRAVQAISLHHGFIKRSDLHLAIGRMRKSSLASLENEHPFAGSHYVEVECSDGEIRYAPNPDHVTYVAQIAAQADQLISCGAISFEDDLLEQPQPYELSMPRTRPINWSKLPQITDGQ